MPLVVICGGPCVGKSRVASLLKAELEARGHKVQVVSDTSLRLPRKTTYAEAAAEKQTRAAVKAAVERLLAPDTVVIADSLNYIKGFRFELACLTKLKTGPSCVVHVIGTKADAHAANEQRIASAGTSDPYRPQE